MTSVRFSILILCIVSSSELFSLINAVRYGDKSYGSSKFSSTKYGSAKYGSAKYGSDSSSSSLHSKSPITIHRPTQKHSTSHRGHRDHHQHHHEQQQQQQLQAQASSYNSKKMSPLEMFIFGPDLASGSSGSVYQDNTIPSASTKSYRTPVQNQQQQMQYGQGGSVGGGLNNFQAAFGGNMGGGYGNGMAGANTGGYGGGFGGGSDGNAGGTVPIAIKSRHSVEYVDIPLEPNNYQPQTILVEARHIPLNILFQSRSSQLNIQNEHTPSQGSLQETSSEDEPHHLIHRVTKPIYQEVYEVIRPYRKITQEVAPVQEDIQTIVSRAIPLDSKYVPVNNQFKGKNQMNQPSSQQIQSPIQIHQAQQQQTQTQTQAQTQEQTSQQQYQPTTMAPAIIQQEMIQQAMVEQAATAAAVTQQAITQQALAQAITEATPIVQQQADILYDQSMAGSYQQLSSNPLGYIDATRPYPNSQLLNIEPDVFLNVIQNEMNKMKQQQQNEQYKTQSTSSRNSYIVSPIHDLNSIYDDKKATTFNNDYQSLQQSSYQLDPYMQVRSREPRSEHHTQQHQSSSSASSSSSSKLQTYSIEPQQQPEKKTSPLDSSSYVTTIGSNYENVPTSTISSLATTTPTPTTTLKPLDAAESEGIMVTTVSSINANNNINKEEDNGIQSLMMYSGGGSLFVTQPNLITKEDRKRALKTFSYSISSPRTNSYTATMPESRKDY